jgi:hypothetical protein
MFGFFRKIVAAQNRIAEAHERMAVAQELIARCSKETHASAQESHKESVAYYRMLRTRQQNEDLQSTTVWSKPERRSSDEQGACSSFEHAAAIGQFYKQEVTVSRQDNLVTLECRDAASATLVTNWLMDVGPQDYMEPSGWTIISIGDDCSVLCESPAGTRRRYWFIGKQDATQKGGEA